MRPPGRAPALLAALTLTLAATAAEPPPRPDLLRGAVEVYTQLRTPDGAYRAMLRLDGESTTRSSIACVGPGLIALCVEDALGWNDQAETLALQTLRLLNGQAGFAVDRSAGGFYRHFFDARTGRGDSEFSTMDTALAAAGAVACANHFTNSAAVRAAAAELWNRIAWTNALVGLPGARVHLAMTAEGPPARETTRPFNEYLLVAWYGHAQRGGVASTFFAFYPPPDRWPRSQDFGLPTDRPEQSLSGFTILFPYYLAEPARRDPGYRAQLTRWVQAERAHWADKDPVAWGAGAGEGPRGYQVDSLTRHSFDVISPAIIAGFLPVDPEGALTLDRLWEDGRGWVEVNGQSVLGRFSLQQSDWKPRAINGIDFSTYLYGLAATDPRLPGDFFDRLTRLDAVRPPGPLGLQKESR